MRKNWIMLWVPALLLSGTAWAERDIEEPASVTVKEVEEVEGLKDEIFGVKPQLGVLVFRDNLGNDTSRFAAGLTLDLNAMSWIDPNLKQWYVGPSTGLIYAHLGSPDSNFFGTDSPIKAGAGANFFYIPINLKAGYTFANDFRVALHGGGNILYRSVANSMNLGDSSLGTSSNTTIFPNVGADFEVTLDKRTALMVRPDLTITPGDEFFTGTLALSIGLG